MWSGKLGNTDVTFWGAQWWKENEVSTDATWPSFKGWATNVDMDACKFSTRTGTARRPRTTRCRRSSG